MIERRVLSSDEETLDLRGFIAGSACQWRKEGKCANVVFGLRVDFQPRSTTREKALINQWKQMVTRIFSRVMRELSIRDKSIHHICTEVNPGIGTCSDRVCSGSHEGTASRLIP